jgi:hypothetical protein
VACFVCLDFSQNISIKKLISLVCLGTDNSLNKITIGPNSTHYDRLLRSYVRCKKISGNLEITHIRPPDLRDDVDAINQPDGTVIRRQRTPFWFLSELEEVGIKRNLD